MLDLLLISTFMTSSPLPSRLKRFLRTGNVSQSARTKIQDLIESSQQTRDQLQEAVRIQSEARNALEIMQNEKAKAKDRDKSDKDKEKEKEREKEKEKEKEREKETEKKRVVKQTLEPVRFSAELVSNINKIGLSSIPDESNLILLVRLLICLIALLLYATSRLVVIFVMFVFHVVCGLAPQNKSKQEHKESA